MSTPARAQVVGRSSADRQPVARARSRVSNGHAVLPDCDGRSALARRYKDIVASIVTDLDGQVTEVKLQLVRRFSAASCLAEQLEAKLAAGEEIDIAQHAALSSTLVRLSARIGLDRVPRDVTPSLGDLLRDHQGSEAPFNVE